MIYVKGLLIFGAIFLLGVLICQILYEIEKRMYKE